MRRRRRQRPGLLTTLGILCIVLGGLSLACSIFGLGANAMASSARKSATPRVYDPGAAQLAALDRDAPNWQRAEIAHDVLVIVLAVLLIAAGIGLLKQQNWARWLAVATAVACVVVRLAYGLYKATVAIPAVERFQLTQPHPPGFITGFRLGAYGTVGATLLLWLIFGLALGITMFAPSVREACAPVRSRRDERDDEDDDEYEDRPRRRRRRRDDEYDDRYRE